MALIDNQALIANQALMWKGFDLAEWSIKARRSLHPVERTVAIATLARRCA